MPYLAAGAQSREEVYKNFSKDIAEHIISASNEYIELEGVREFLAITGEHIDIIQLHNFRGAEGGIKLDLEQSMMLDFIVLFSNDYFSGNTIPFFDEVAGYLAKTVTEFDKTIPQRLSTEQSKQIAIVSDLISRLPLFEKASADEIFDIRKELEKPLVNFRSQIIQISKEVETAPWNRDFPSAVEQLFIEKIEPAIVEIEDACKSNRLLSSIISNLAKKPLVIPATSAIGLVLSTSTQIPNVIAQALSLSAGGAILASEAIKEWREKQRGIEKNGFYFYYRLGKKFAQPRKTISQSLKNILHSLRR